MGFKRHLILAGLAVSSGVAFMHYSGSHDFHSTIAMHAREHAQELLGQELALLTLLQQAVKKQEPRLIEAYYAFERPGHKSLYLALSEEPGRVSVISADTALNDLAKKALNNGLSDPRARSLLKKSRLSGSDHEHKAHVISRDV